MPGEFSGTISEIINRPIKTNFDMAILISTLNAVCKYLKITDKSIHCKDEDPEECAKKLVEYIKEKYGHPKIALIGLQPDRKSTRLNSSHANISYAVFCLKKKKKTNDIL